MENGDIVQYDVTLSDLAAVADREQVEILKTDTKEVVQNFGKIKVASRKNGYVMSKMGDVKDFGSEGSVDSLVFRTVGVATCRRPSGQEFEISIDKLNS